MSFINNALNELGASNVGALAMLFRFFENAIASLTAKTAKTPHFQATSVQINAIPLGVSTDIDLGPLGMNAILTGWDIRASNAGGSTGTISVDGLRVATPFADPSFPFTTAPGATNELSAPLGFIAPLATDHVIVSVTRTVGAVLAPNSIVTITLFAMPL